MRIAILLNTNVGGRWSVPSAAAMVQRGDDVLAVLAREEGDLGKRYEAVGVQVRYHDFDKAGVRAVPRSWLDIRRDLRSFEPDVIVYYLYKAALFGRTIGRSLRKPTVHMIVGPAFLEVGPTRLVERVGTRLDTAIGAGSVAIQRSLESLGARESTVIYPPCDLHHYRPADQPERVAQRATLGIEADAFVVVLVAYWYSVRPFQGSTKHSKGHDVALKAWAATPHRPGDRLLIVGGGFRTAGRAYREEFLLEHSHLVDETVMFVDTVPDSRRFYAAADVSIAPSTTENLGSAAEASAMGVPSIASRTGGLPEIVIPGYSGWLADVGDVDGFAEALADAIRAQRDGRLGRYGHRARALSEALFPTDLVARQVCDLVDRTARAGRSR